MAYDIIQFRNPLTGERRSAPAGFSWTMLFFGPIPPLLRGDWRWFLLLLLLSVPTFGAASIVGAFLWNRSYMTRLVEQGFQMLPGSVERDASLAAYVGFDIPALEGVAPVESDGPRINNPATEDAIALRLLAGAALVIVLVTVAISQMA